MSVKRYLSPVIGSGKTTDDAVRPLLQDLVAQFLAPGTICAASYCTASDGSFCLVTCVLDDAVHAALAADPRLYCFPDLELAADGGASSIPVGSGDPLPTVEQTALDDQLANLKLPVIQGEALEDTLVRVGKLADPDFLLEHQSAYAGPDKPASDAKVFP